MGEVVESEIPNGDAANGDGAPPEEPSPEADELPLSKNARKRLLKQQRREEKKAEKKKAEKEEKRRKAEERRREWQEKISSVETEEERAAIEESRLAARRERMEARAGERERKRQKLTKGMEEGQRIVVDLDFPGLMAPAEINSLMQQIMYCYAVNGRCDSPCHLCLTGCTGEIATQLQRIPGFDKWLIRKESKPYAEVFHDQKDSLVYLTADSDNVLEELDPSKIYIIGGLVDRNRWKGITMKKAKEDGIKTAKLPISDYLKMSTSMVLTVNQVVEILLRFLETKDWKNSFFQVIPQRKRCEAEDDEEEDEYDGDMKKICIEKSPEELE
ncbi:tRNA (guanine(9)-N1)-methyltransferase [Nymphaea thermarum]|nr:tRNA (guanine(9)-N1)-methyltransferase [Nymphaea thermarum]